MQPELISLPVFFHKGSQQHSGKPGDNGSHGNKAADNQCREVGHQSGPEKFYQDREEKGGSYQQEQGRQTAEKCHRPVVFIKPENGAENLQTVRAGVQFGLAALRAVSVVYDDICNIHILVHGMDGHLCLNLKALGQHRKAFDKEKT